MFIYKKIYLIKKEKYGGTTEKKCRAGVSVADDAYTGIRKHPSHPVLCLSLPSKCEPGFLLEGKGQKLPLMDKWIMDLSALWLTRLLRDDWRCAPAALVRLCIGLVSFLYIIVPLRQSTSISNRDDLCWPQSKQAQNTNIQTGEKKNQHMIQRAPQQKWALEFQTCWTLNES